MKIEIADACQKAAEMFNVLATEHNVNIVGTIVIMDKNLTKPPPPGEVPMQVTHFDFPKPTPHS